MKSDPKLSEFSPITFFVYKVFDWIKWLSLMKLLNKFKYFHLLKPRSELSRFEILDPNFAKRRGYAIELYLIGWIVFEVTCSILACTIEIHFLLKFLLLIFIVSRIIEIIQVTVNATIFDALNGRPDNMVASKARMVILSFINFLKLIICFGIIYAFNIYLLKSNCTVEKISSFYFSIITQLTIGYGDIFPKGYLRIVAASQGLAGLLFVVLILGRFINVLPRIDSLFDRTREN